VAARTAREAVVADNVPEYREARDRARRLDERIDALYDDLATRRSNSRTRESVPELEEDITRLKQERSEAWGEAAKAKEPFWKALEPHWNEFKRRKEQILKASGKTSAKAKGDAQREALQQMRELDGVPQPWMALAEINELSNGYHCAVRRKDWRPAELNERGLKAWSSVLDKDTKELAHEAFKQAKSKTAAEGGRMREPRGEEGRVGRMWGAEGAPVIGDDGSIQSSDLSLVPQEGTGNDHRESGSKRSALRKRMDVTLRIAGREMKARVLVHRPLPPKGIVTRAWFMRKPLGALELQLVVRYPEANRRPAGKRLSGIAVRVGWAKDANNPEGRDHAGLIVAHWLGSDGREGVIELDAPSEMIPDQKPTPKVQHSLSDAEELRSHQDDHRNEVVEAFRAFVASGATVPDWLHEAMRYSASWRNSRRLAGIALQLRDLIPEREALWKEWVEACKDRKADLFPEVGILDRWLVARGTSDPLVRWATILEWWRRKDAHLRTWEQNQRDTAQLRRRDFYRVQAARLASVYEGLAIVEVDLKSAARKKAPEQKIEGPEKAVTKQRRQACPSELIAALGNAFRVTPKAAKVSAKSLEEALKKRKFVASKTVGPP
jgi:hypothetical protein